MGSPVGADSKQSEKEYLRRTAGGAWERLKPFSPPGTSTLGDSAALIQDFAAALHHLPPSPEDLILDLGAGACWCSDWLQRLNLRTVAVDISVDMLHLGRSRLTGPRPWVVAGDLERLPFATATFDKAYCLSAIHHIPDIPSALAELSRVLTPSGAVLFSEPGVGHAGKAGSVTAMRDFGVLEQDIVASKFMAACADAGFPHVTLRPMSYLIPQVELTASQWDAWARRAESKRPVRAAHTIWRGVLELLGLGKHDALVEETLSMQLVRLLRGAMADHPVIVAAKRRPAKVPGTARRAEIQILAAPSRATAGARLTVRLRIRNTGEAAWHTDRAARTPAVRLGVQLLAADERLLDRDFYRQDLSGPVAPGQTLDVDLTCPVPDARGPHYFKFDLVEEGVTWFEPQGSAIARHAVEITERV
jgi:ubiquinone/menaquinone biosynthesis C-methylase UbiE